MSNRDIGFYIVDIFIAIDKIYRYTNIFKNADDLLHDELHWDATIRELEIIGEATKNLLNENLLNLKYRRIVDFRNQISHGYFGIDENIVWDIINNKLNLYEKDLRELVCLESIDIITAIHSAKEEYRKNDNILKLLTTLS